MLANCQLKGDFDNLSHHGENSWFRTWFTIQGVDHRIQVYGRSISWISGRTATSSRNCSTLASSGPCPTCLFKLDIDHEEMCFWGFFVFSYRKNSCGYLNYAQIIYQFL